MGEEQLAGSQRADAGSPKVHFKRILASNSGQCVEASPGVGLNLGCGKCIWPGWINVDAEHGDLKCDLRALELPSDYADVAIAVHVIEHFYAWEVQDVLQEWRRVLKPGGRLILELPCMDKVLAYIYACMKNGVEVSKAMGWYVLWGDPKYKDPLMVHKYGYTQAMIQSAMEQAGFKEVRFETPNYHFEMRDMRVVGIK